MTVKFVFDDKGLQSPAGETYREQYARLQEKRDLTIAKHFLDFGKRHPDVDMDDELIADILKRMDFEV